MPLTNEVKVALQDHVDNFLCDEFDDAELKGMVVDLQRGHQPVEHEMDLVEQHLGNLFGEDLLPRRERLEEVVQSQLADMIDARIEDENAQPMSCGHRKF